MSVSGGVSRGVSIDHIQMKSKLDELSELLKNVNSVSLKLSNIYNNCIFIKYILFR